MSALEGCLTVIARAAGPVTVSRPGSPRHSSCGVFWARAGSLRTSQASIAAATNTETKAMTAMKSGSISAETAQAASSHTVLDVAVNGVPQQTPGRP